MDKIYRNTLSHGNAAWQPYAFEQIEPQIIDAECIELAIHPVQ